jgi:hypothetical protein
VPGSGEATAGADNAAAVAAVHVAAPLLQALLPLLYALTQSPRLSADPEVLAAHAQKTRATF